MSARLLKLLIATRHDDDKLALLLIRIGIQPIDTPCRRTEKM